MPTYEYRCENGHTFEVMQRISDDPVQACETCGAPVRRVFHPVAVHFKGSGFYNTDYGTRKRAREQKESGGDGAKTAEGAGDKSSSGAGEKSSSGEGAKPAGDAGKASGGETPKSAAA